MKRILIPECTQDMCMLWILSRSNISFSCISYRFKGNLRQCLLQINGYNNLFEAVEELRKEVFDSENEEHENMLLKVMDLQSDIIPDYDLSFSSDCFVCLLALLQLWDLLMPSEKLESRITKQWGNIGFQGDDPKTDFRGMGMLGLSNLLYVDPF